MISSLECCISSKSPSENWEFLNFDGNFLSFFWNKWNNCIDNKMVKMMRKTQKSFSEKKTVAKVHGFSKAAVSLLYHFFHFRCSNSFYFLHLVYNECTLTPNFIIQRQKWLWRTSIQYGMVWNKSNLPLVDQLIILGPLAFLWLK